LQAEDTGADPVVAALATRRLCHEAGSIAIIGALMSAPTAAASVAADACGVPLVSPTATNDRIWEIGGKIFQTNQSEVFETRLLAQLACTLLLKQRFAVIYPRSAEGQRSLEAFTGAVEELGGEVIADVAFAPETTDFREAIETLKRVRPEVIYVPASVDQTILLGPQLDFFSVGTLILGPSAWNTPKLLEKTGAVMEGAVFPSDQAFFPTEWTAEFTQCWQREQYPSEATRLALRAYQATRMVLDTLAQSGVRDRDRLAEALQLRLSSREIETEGPESFSRSARIIHDGEIFPFPAHLFTEGWEYAEAAADSLWSSGTDDAEISSEPDG
jgi:branched-chain amino acid transport system substrate-binding protein